MKRRHYRWAFGVLVICLLAGGYRWYGTETTAVANHPSTLVQRGTVERSVSALGTVEPKDFVDVGAQASGQIERIHVELGDSVEAGDLLVEIDPDVFEARVDADRAELRRLRALLAEREAQLELSRKQFQRQKELLARRATSQEAYDNAEAAVQIADAQIEGLRAQIDQSQSSLRANEANLGYTRIYAPMSGTVVSLDARVGQTLNANQSTPIILRIADLSTMTVRAEVSEADILKLREEMDVWFTTLGERNRQWQGKLRQILPMPAVLNDVVLYHALFDVDNSDRTLLPQMTAQVHFVEEKSENTLYLPIEAVIVSQSTPGTSGSVRIRRGEDIVERTVELGVRDQVNLEIVKGLQEGDHVLLPVLEPQGVAGRRR